jgi:ActR/RegA family two-component response regulator
MGSARSSDPAGERAVRGARKIARRYGAFAESSPRHASSISGQSARNDGGGVVNILLVHRDSRVIEILRRGVERAWDATVTAADTIDIAVRQARWKIDMIIFDLQMDRFKGLRVERALRRANPDALLIAVGPSVPGSAAFRLVSVGVCAYLDLPLDEERVQRCLHALTKPSDPLIHAAKREVGNRDLKQAQRAVRLSMCEEALERNGGSRRAAARTLGVDRRAVQKIAGELADRVARMEVAAPAPLIHPLPLRATRADGRDAAYREPCTCVDDVQALPQSSERGA